MKNFFLIFFVAGTTLVVPYAYSAANSTNPGLTTAIKSHFSKNKAKCSTKLPCASALTSQFYQKNAYTPIWLKKNAPNNDAVKMATIISNSYQDGLNPEKYHQKALEQLLAHINHDNDNDDDDEEDSDKVQLLANFEVTLTDAFFLYTHDLHYGLLNPSSVFKYWTITPKPVNMLNLLANNFNNDGIQATIDSIAPKYSGYAKLKAKMNEYQQVAINTGGWEKIPDENTLQLGDKGPAVTMLKKRLLISGELGSIDHGAKFDDTLKQAVILFQQNNGLYDDGEVDNDTLAVLNTPITARIQQMAMNLDKMRWLPESMGKQYILINLPAYTLRAMKNDELQIGMDAAVGDVNHPSCILSSKINNVILNPYWNLPTSIAGEELWPKLKSEKDFLKRKHYEVLKVDASGNYKVVPSPQDINWKNISEKEFNSYRFRQDPGKDNSLGKVKFRFNNPCMMYLHDTNDTEIFDVYRRDFSHGCIRVGEPRKLSYYILTQQANWNRKRVDSFYKDGKSQSITLSNPINLYLTYFTSWVSDDDWTQFRSDIYHLDQMSKYKVYLPQANTKDADEDSNDD